MHFQVRNKKNKMNTAATLRLERHTNGTETVHYRVKFFVVASCFFSDN